MISAEQEGRRGSALVLAIITALVLTVLVGALFLLFQSNMAAYEWHKEELQCMYSAESGARLATYMILEGSDLPQTDTEQFLPESGPTWFSLPGEDLGETLVYVDPHRQNAEITASNAYVVRALGRIVVEEEAYTFGMENMLMPENFSRFSCFQNLGFASGYYDDGYRFDGPFHSNGPINIWSGSVGSLNDPYFYSLSIARRTGGDGYYYGQSQGGGTLTDQPAIGALTIQPIDRMLMGPPFFDMHADSIPYGSSEVNWEPVENAAKNGGLYFGPEAPGPSELPDGARLMIANDKLLVKRNSTAAVEEYILSDLANPVVWIDNGPNERVYLRQLAPDSIPSTGLEGAYTIGMMGDLYLSGALKYQDTDIVNPNNDDMLGIITVKGDIIMAYDPDAWGGPDWPEPWEIMMDAKFQYYAVLMSLDGVIEAEWYPSHSPYPASGDHTMELTGGYIAQTEGVTSSSGGGGFAIDIYYDTRLMSQNPPFFPSTGKWHEVFWKERPDLEEDDMGEDYY
ncbi:MAG: hypothetical protein GF388_03295 [Candidatus Aegiribacteria sp.]|nr:hypothetical protein [Candidatus Aegiribacteria sp.]